MAHLTTAHLLLLMVCIATLPVFQAAPYNRSPKKRTQDYETCMKKASTKFNTCFQGLIVYIIQQRVSEYIKQLEVCSKKLATREAKCKKCKNSSSLNPAACE